MENLKLRKFLILSSAGFLIIFFQNCSDIQTAQLLKGQDHVSGVDGIVGPEVSPLTPPNSGETIVLDDRDNTNVQTTTANQPTAGTVTTPGVPEGENPHVTVETTPDQVEPQVDFSAACKDLKLFGIKNVLLDVKNVEGLHGKAIIKSDQIDLIQDHSSVLVVVGKTSVAMISNINDVHGYTVICNAVVNRIESVSGTLVLVDTIVNDLIDQRGRLVSIRSKIKNQIND